MSKITDNERILLDAFGELMVSFNLREQVESVSTACLGRLSSNNTATFVAVLNMAVSNATTELLLDAIEEALD
jgi:hypothetical protein